MSEERHVPTRVLFVCTHNSARSQMEAKREAVALEPQELVELEQIVTDEDRDSAHLFLKERV